MTSALVLGSNGFVGRALVAALCRSGVIVQGVSRTATKRSDIPTCRPEDLASLAAPFDCVYLLAAVVPYGAMDRVTPELITSNIGLPQMVVERYPKARLVFASSVAVYGRPLRLPVCEEHPFHQPSAYGLSKAFAERIVAGHENAVSLRFSSIYGSGMTAPTFIPKIIEQARMNQRIILHGDGSRTQDYLYLDDAVGMLLAAGTSRPTGTFNAVSGTSTTNREVAQCISEQHGGVPIGFQGADGSSSCAFSRARWDKTFEYRPHVALAEGIQRMLSGSGSGTIFGYGAP